MPANKRRTSPVKAPRDRWVVLGKRLEARRRWLGHTWRTTFQQDRGINRRLSADIENAMKDRINHFMPGTMELVAMGYAVEEESMYAILRGETDELIPVSPVAAVPLSPGLGDAPMTDPQRMMADEPYATPIFDRLAHLQSEGILDPPGKRIFGPASPYARIWDEMRDWPGLRFPGDLVWVMADVMRRAADHRAQNLHTGTGTDGVLSRSQRAGERSHPGYLTVYPRKRLRVAVSSRMLHWCRITRRPPAGRTCRGRELGDGRRSTARRPASGTGAGG